MSLLKDFKSGKSPGLIILLMLIFGVILIFFPILFTKFKFIGLDNESTGELGDVISGTTMLFISFAGIILTFYAFWIQYKANIELRRDIEIERFENKYYELLKLHKENVNEINIENKIHGRDVFAELYKELKFVFHFTKKLLTELNTNEFKFDPNRDEIILEIAYILFFIGVQRDSNIYLEKLLEKYFNLKAIKELITKVLSEKEKSDHPNNLNKPSTHIYLIDNMKVNLSFNFIIFQGHLSRLGHYYRHLFQLFDFIDNKRSFYPEEKDKYNYAKTIRGQLSAYEQLLLYYNSLSFFGNAWLKQEHPYLIKYRLIKNIPLYLSDFGINPEIKFKEEIEEFRKNGLKFFELR